MRWARVKLGEVCIDKGIQTGPFGSQLHHSDYSETGTPVVMPVDLVDGSISTKRIARVSDDHVRRLARHKLRSGDIVYSRRGDVGRCARVTAAEEGWLCGTGCLRVSGDPKRVCPDFLYYALSNPEVVGWVQSHAVGATMPNLNTKILESIPFVLPSSLIEQERIVEILGAYDKLIENNRKQIALLEEAAQRLYKEWFVDLHFPGYENAEIVDGLPEGWRFEPISRYCDVVKGCSYKSNEIDAANGTPMITLASIEPYGGFKPFLERVYAGKRSDSQILVKNDVLMALTEQATGLAGYVARVPRYAQGFLPSMDLVVLRPKSATSSYLYSACVFGQVSRELSPLANGTKIKHLKPEVFDYMKMLVPPDEVQGEFDVKLSKIFALQDSLLEQAYIAREARDRLLPKLMSGELEV